MNSSAINLYREFNVANGHGGRRPGAGKKPGVKIRPATPSLRAVAAERLSKHAGTETDPLNIVLAIAADTGLDVSTRLNAAAIVLPYMYPRLSQTQVDARHVYTTVDATQVLERLSDRLERLSKPEPAPPALIEAKAEPEEDEAGGE
jgi:hypothetical protein